jgi:hypothetical protein
VTGDQPITFHRSVAPVDLFFPSGYLVVPWSVNHVTDLPHDLVSTSFYTLPVLTFKHSSKCLLDCYLLFTKSTFFIYVAGIHCSFAIFEVLNFMAPVP